MFLSYIKEKNWEGLEAMITKQAVLFYENRIVARRDDILDFLESMFMNAKGIVCPHPFIHRPGQTRSSMLLEASEIGRVKRRLFMPQDGDSVSGSEDNENEEKNEEKNEAKNEMSGAAVGAITDGSGSSSSSYSGSSGDSSDENEEESEVQKKRLKTRSLNLPQV